MMEVTVTGSYEPIDVGASGIAEIVQNVKTILTTAKGSVPLDREFGVDMSFMDQPVPTARAMIMASVVEAVNKYEPRVKVTNVGFEEDERGIEGRMIPVVRIVIGEEYL